MHLSVCNSAEVLAESKNPACDVPRGTHIVASAQVLAMDRGTARWLGDDVEDESSLSAVSSSADADVPPLPRRHSEPAGSLAPNFYLSKLRLQLDLAKQRVIRRRAELDDNLDLSDPSEAEYRTWAEDLQSYEQDLNEIINTVVELCQRR